MNELNWFCIKSEQLFKSR